MKNLKFVRIVSSILFWGMLSCVKSAVSVEYTGRNNKPDLVLSKPIVKRGEPLIVSTNAPDSNSLIRWTIRPSDSTLIIQAGNQATIYISLPGTYLITANFYFFSDTTKAYDSSTSNIIVNDSVYAAPPGGSDFDTLSLIGDQITLIPASFSGSGLVLLAKTTRLYNCTSYLSAYGTLQDPPGPASAISFDFSSAIVVESKANCMGAKNPASNTIQLLSLDIGDHPVSAKLNQLNYQGSLHVTDSNYTFTWNYTTGIIISPLQIKKN